MLRVGSSTSRVAWPDARAITIRLAMIDIVETIDTVGGEVR
jgi:hypothetical protein